ncbi:hypothetical protein N787_02775 [Arenimonas metalli CF5-1]|uniref:Uncharacterized protein n=1 Tax=Arenimonas metalli CF5-1 TaxID=1384056 RepID=A0A091B4U3_9GAMM|nr:hypothetical protein N787_02775 [Arenimonas metalli CF5-1]
MAAAVSSRFIVAGAPLATDGVEGEVWLLMGIPFLMDARGRIRDGVRRVPCGGRGGGLSAE